MSGCVCEGVSEISIWISRLIHRPSSVWVAPIKSIEALKRTRSWKKREFVPSACFQAGLLVFSCTQPVCVFSCSIMSDSCPPWLTLAARQALQNPSPWDFPGKNTGVGCSFLLQDILLSQGLDLRLFCLLHWQSDSLLSARPGKPRLSPGT